MSTGKIKLQKPETTEKPDNKAGKLGKKPEATGKIKLRNLGTKPESSGKINKNLTIKQEN